MSPLPRKPSPGAGFVGGVIMAVLLSFVAALIYSIRGPGVFERLGVPLSSVISLYFLSGILGGVAVGALLPITSWRWGAAVVGAVAALPLYVGVGLLLGHSDIIGGVVLAALIGGGVGYGLWEPPGKSEDDPTRRS